MPGLLLSLEKAFCASVCQNLLSYPRLQHLGLHKHHFTLKSKTYDTPKCCLDWQFTRFCDTAINRLDSRSRQKYVLTDWPLVQQLQNTSIPVDNASLLVSLTNVVWLTFLWLKCPFQKTPRSRRPSNVPLWSKTHSLNIDILNVGDISSSRLKQLKVNPASWLANAVKFTRSVLSSTTLGLDYEL